MPKVFPVSFSVRKIFATFLNKEKRQRFLIVFNHIFQNFQRYFVHKNITSDECIKLTYIIDHVVRFVHDIKVVVVPKIRSLEKKVFL